MQFGEHNRQLKESRETAVHKESTGNLNLTHKEKTEHLNLVHRSTGYWIWSFEKRQNIWIWCTEAQDIGFDLLREQNIWIWCTEAQDIGFDPLREQNVWIWCTEAQNIWIWSFEFQQDYSNLRSSKTVVLPIRVEYGFGNLARHRQQRRRVDRTAEMSLPSIRKLNWDY